MSFSEANEQFPVRALVAADKSLPTSPTGVVAVLVDADDETGVGKSDELTVLLMILPSKASRLTDLSICTDRKSTAIMTASGTKNETIDE